MSYYRAVAAVMLIATPAFAAPPNDLFANRIVLTGSNVTVSGSLLGATLDTGEPNHSIGGWDVRSVWWSWTAPAAGTVVLSAGQSGFVGASIGVYTGNSVSALARLTNAPGDDFTTLPVISGATYQIAVADNGSGDANIVLTLQLFPRPANDNFANRTIIPSAPASVFGWTVGASQEPGEPYWYPESSVWWQWTTPATGRAHFRVNPQSDSRNLIIFSSTNFSQLTSLGYTYSWGDATIEVIAGRSYAIGVFDPPTRTGAFELEVSLSTFAILSPLSNQTFYAPSPIDIDFQVTTFYGAPTRIDILAHRNYLVEDILLGSLDRPPWRFTWSNPEPARYRLFARMIGPRGEVVSDEVPISVTTSNDLFAGSTVIPGREFQLPAPLGTASLEPGEPSHGEHLEHSLWWSWTAPTNGLLLLSRAPYGDSFVAPTYVGSTLTQLAEVARMDFYWPIYVPVTAGQTYHMAAAAEYGGTLSYLIGKFYERPLNDDFTNRILLVGNSLSFSNSNVAATAEPGEPIHAGATERRTLWWRWKAPSDGDLQLKAYGEHFYGVIAVYNGTNLVRIADGPTGENQAVVLRARAGLVYQIAVDGRGTPFESRGDFLFTLQFDPAPANDLFANRATLTGFPVSVTADNTHASAEPGEPPPISSGLFPADKSLWWQWTAPRTARVGVTFQGCCYIAAVYQGSNLTNLTRVPGKLMGGGGFAFQVQAGQTYLISVGGYVGWSGSEFTLILRDCPNDNFADRIPLTGLHVAATNDNVAATSELGEPQHAPGVLPARTLWWSWRAPYSGIATLHVRALFQAVAAVYTGTNLASLVSITNLSQHGSYGPISFPVTAGTDYQIAVGGWYGPGYGLEGGYFEFSIDLNTFYLASPPWEMVATVPQQIRLATGPIIPEIHGTVRDIHIWVQGKQFFWPDELLGIVHDSSQSVVRTFDQPGEYRFYAVATNDAGDMLLTDHAKVTLRPTNDNFGKRIHLTGTNVVATGLVAAVTFQPDEPKPYKWAYGTTWWSWTAPAAGRYAFFSSNYLLAVYTGANLSSLVAITSSPPVIVNAQAGAAYQVQVFWVDPAYVPPGNVFSITRVIRPPNDYFTNRTLLVGSNLDFPVSFLDTSREAGEPVIAGEEQNLTLWWRWVAPSDGELSVDADVNGGAYVHIYRGSSLASLVHQPEFEMGARARVVGGRSYQIVMTRWRNWPVEPRLQLSFIPAPPNDYFTNSIRVSGYPLTLQGSTVAATPDMDDPFFDGGSIWWSWTAPVTANVLLSTTNSVTDPYVPVFQGATIESLTRLDEVFAGPGLYIFHAEGGQMYHIAAIPTRELGPVTIELQIPPAPANDHFTNSFVLTTNHITGFADMLNATREPGEFEHGGYAQGATVWYSWRAPSEGKAAFTIPYGPRVAVYVDDPLGTLLPVLTLITFDRRTVFRTTSNVLYHFAIASGSPMLGTDFSFDFPPDRAFEARQLLTGTDIQVNASSGGWWTWQAPVSGRAEIVSPVPSPPLTEFSVHSGASGHDLSSVAYAFQQLTFSAVAGRWYHIQVTPTAPTTNITFQLRLFPATPDIDAVTHATNSFRFDLHGTPGETFLLETSTNLIHWLPLGLHTFYGPAYPFSDTQATDPVRFYRAGPIR